MHGPHKESLEKMKLYNEHTDYDIWESPVVTTKFDKERSTIRTPNSNPLITYDNPNGLKKAFEDIQEPLEKPIHSCFHTLLIVYTLFSILNTISTIKIEMIYDLLLIVKIHLPQQRNKNFNKRKKIFNKSF